MNDDIEKDFEHIHEDYDILIVGGGPAGLAATNGSNNLKTLIIDMGKVLIHILY
jgi:thioredoxin reductase